MVPNNKITQENDSHLITIFSYLPVVDGGDGVIIPADHHGADSGPGSLLRIELQDVVSVGVLTATCIVFYIITRIVLVTTQIMSSHQVSMFVPVTNTLLSSVAPLRPTRGEGRAAE